MSRTLTANTIAKIETKLGTEPLTIVKVEWVSGAKYYSDKTFSVGPINCIGAILNLSDLVGEISGVTFGEVGGSSIILSDTEGELKSLFDSEIITKRPITIYHYFEGTDEADLTSIFVGEISDDIEWDEGDRTLSFSIDSRIKSEDLLLEIKETSLDFPEEDDIGTVIPLCFGTCLRVPAVSVNRSSVGELLSPIYAYTTWYGVSGDAGKITAMENHFYVKGGELFPRTPLILEIDGTLFSGQFDSVEPNLFKATLGGFNWSYNTVDVNARIESDVDFSNPAALWVSDAEDLSGKYLRFELDVEYEYTEELTDSGTIRHLIEDSAVPVNEDASEVDVKKAFEFVEFVAKVNSIEGNKVFLNKECTDDFGRLFLLGEDGNGTHLKWIAGKPEWRWKRLPEPNIKLRWDIPVGSVVRIYQDEAPLHICNSVPSTEILEVMAYRDNLLVPIPSSYYTKHLDYPADVNGTIENLTAITFDKGLGSRQEGWDSSQIYVSLRSSIHGSPIPECNTLQNVLDWIITNRTNLTKDATTFSAIGAKIENYPSHFALFSQIDSVDAMRDIAHKSRLGLFIDNNIVYANYLSEEPITSSYDLSISKMQMKSLIVRLDNSSEISTKITSLWNFTYAETEKRKIVKFNNVDIYGVEEEEIDFQIYNIESLVDKSATFWMNRYSNDWKYIEVNTFLTSLSVQMWDTVEVTIPYINSGSALLGTVTKISHDTEDQNIHLGIWLPLTLGAGTAYLDDSFDTMPEDPAIGLSEVDYTLETDSIVRTMAYPSFRDKGRITSEDGENRLSELEVQQRKALDAMDLKERYFRITSIGNNILTGILLNDNDLTKDGVLRHDFDGSTSTRVSIAKSLEIRESFWKDKIINGVTYVKLGQQNRRADGFVLNDDEVLEPYAQEEIVNPPYNHGEGTTVITKAQYCPKGTGLFAGAPVVWQEVSERAWAKVKEIEL